MCLFANQSCNVHVPITCTSQNYRRQIYSTMYNLSRLPIPQWEGKPFYRDFHILQIKFWEGKKINIYLTKKETMLCGKAAGCFSLSKKMALGSWILDHSQCILVLSARSQRTICQSHLKTSYNGITSCLKLETVHGFPVQGCRSTENKPEGITVFLTRPAGDHLHAMV